MRVILSLANNHPRAKKRKKAVNTNMQSHPQATKNFKPEVDLFRISPSSNRIFGLRTDCVDHEEVVQEYQTEEVGGSREGRG